MMRNLLLPGAAFFSFLLLPCMALAQDADVVAKADESVIRIEVKNVGQGSGYVVSESGIAVTNVHVMAGAQNGKATATFPNGEERVIKGSYLIDAGKDICVIQLEGQGFKPLPLSDSLPRKGEEVIALGSPMGLSFTVTRGVVSAIRGEEEMKRDLNDSTMRGTWVQVDAALSPGNSGGPLINGAGQLVAMSTRASSGRAQNLNFGISVADIKAAINDAKGKTLTPLSDGVGKVDMDEIKPESGDIVQRVEVPEGAIKDYVDRGREAFADLTKGLRREVTTQNDLYRQMKQGKIDGSFGDLIARERGSGKFFFGNESLKNSMLSRQEDRIRDLTKIRDSIGKTPTNESLNSLLWNYGPRLDPRKKGSVGFLPDAYVLHAATEHDVIIEFEGVDYLIWVKDTTGLAIGQKLTPTPVYVVGSQTMGIRGGGSVAVTVLNSVLETELKNVVFAGAPEKADDNAVAADKSAEVFRKWRDQSGKFEVEATLVTADTKQVVLKKKDGSIVTVPIDKLSDADKKELKKKK
ncbi:MAG: trypsin-like peptidase domain-containing protein [Pirellulaceae bacterium]